ncbi:MAG: alpha/beta fold hydrolase [Hydrogenovibrio sp.]
MMRRILVLSALPILISGCFSDSSSSSGSDPMTRYTQQTLNWQACDPDLFSDTIGSEMATEAIEALGDRLQCTQMTVPMDYNAVDKADLVIAVSRTRAAEPAQRFGNLFFNPGGPGGDGLSYAALYGELWQNANPDNPIGEQLKTLNNRFDLIGFSPRGTGSSTNLNCSGQEVYKPTSTHTDSDDNTQNQLDNAKLVAQTCLKNPMARYINTEQTVRDMDLLRQLLGDDKLNFIGYSYGTWLGSWYASRFPQHTGRMLLDSNMNFTSTFDKAIIRNAAGRQRLIDDYWAPFAAEHNDVFLLGDTTEAVRGVFPRLSIPQQDLFTLVVAERIGNSSTAIINLFLLRIHQVLNSLIQQNPDADPTTLRELVATTDFLPNPENNLQARIDANKIIDQLSNENEESDENAPEPDRIYLKPSSATYTTVICNDTPSNPDPQFWIDTGKQQLREYPFFGNDVTEQPCLYWGGPSVTKPNIQAANTTEAGILMLQSEYDPLTPIAGAKEAFSHLTHARFITVNHESNHGLFPYGTECVDLTVAQYFNDGLLPDALMQTCEGKGWPPIDEDDDVSDTQDSKSSKSPKNAVQTDIYLNPERAHQLLEAIKSGIGAQANPREDTPATELR